MSFYDWYPKPSQPKKTDQGIKAKSKRGDFVSNWWATRWIRSLEQLMDPGRLSRGRRYARQGQVLSIKEEAEGIEAKVQGSRSSPYTVTLRLEPLNEAQWDRVIAVLVNRAIFAAQLLAGEMPQDIDEAFAAAGVSLFPRHKGELVTACSCPDWAEVCKHIAAVHYLLGEQFDEDPWLLFRLRGRSKEQLLTALGERRGTSSMMAGVETPTPPLTEALEEFWGDAASFDLAFDLEPPKVPLAALRRLGQATFSRDDLTKLLQPVYQAVSLAALDVALGEDAETDEV